MEQSFNVHFADRMTYANPAGPQRHVVIVYFDTRIMNVAVNTNIAEYLKYQPLHSFSRCSMIQYSSWYLILEQSRNNDFQQLQ